MKWPLYIAIGGAVIFGLASWRAKAAEREDRYPPTHQLKVCEPGKECESRGRPSGATACSLNLASEQLQAALPSGTLLACVRVAK